MKNLINQNFIIRLISSIVMVCIFTFGVFYGGFVFSLMILLITFFSHFEWFAVIFDKIKFNCNNSNESVVNNSKIIAKKNMTIWMIIGSFIILPFSISMLYLRFSIYGSDYLSPILYILFFFSITAATDIGAYIFGRIIGGPKIWPKISPNKTISGSFFGIICALVTAYCIYLFSNKLEKNPLSVILGISLIISILSQIGGLVMSAFKRHFGVKDWGKSIPGHGGFLDRLDSFIFSLPLYTILIILKVFV